MGAILPYQIQREEKSIQNTSLFETSFATSHLNSYLSKWVSEICTTHSCYQYTHHSRVRDSFIHNFFEVPQAHPWGYMCFFKLLPLIYIHLSPVFLSLPLLSTPPPVLHSLCSLAHVPGGIFALNSVIASGAFCFLALLWWPVYLWVESQASFC